MCKNTKVIAICLLCAILSTSTAGLLNRIRVSKLENQVDKLQSTQTKLEKRVDNLQQAMQTKDKELEAGMRNNYQGLMHKIEFIERETGVSE